MRLCLLQQVNIQKKVYPNNNSNASEYYYDLYEDWELIEASFLKQYNMRLRTIEDLSWSEFCSLLGGLMKDTPLATIVAIRAEDDYEVIKTFNKDQHRIRNEWNAKHGKGLSNLEKMQKQLKAMFCK